MALLSCEYYSNVIGMMSRMTVILPQGRLLGPRGERVPVLYLLHGLSDNETAWTRRTSIERYAEKYNIAVVMPTTHRGWYTDAVNGYRYYEHVAVEVPQMARAFFPLSDRREDNFIAGLSMGGYGAFKIATRNPQRFCAAASLSGALDVGERIAQVVDPKTVDEFVRIFGDLAAVRGTENDLFNTTQRMSALPAAQQVRLFQCCGTEDFLYAMNQRYREHVQTLPLTDYTYEEGPGDHSWEFWDCWIQRVLEWLAL